MSRDARSKSYDSVESNAMDSLLSLYLKGRINADIAATSDNEKDKDTRLWRAAKRSIHRYYINFPIKEKNPRGDTRKALQKVEELAINLYKSTWKRELYTIKKHGVLIRNYLEPALVNYHDLLKVIGYEERHEKYILDIKNVMAKDSSSLSKVEYLRQMFRDKVLKVALDLYTLQLKYDKTYLTEFTVPALKVHSSAGGSDLPQSSSSGDLKDDDLYGRGEKSAYEQSHRSEAGNGASGKLKPRSKIKDVNKDLNKVNKTEIIIEGKFGGKVSLQFDKENMNKFQGTVNTQEKIKEEKPKENDRQKEQEKKKQENNKVENTTMGTFEDKIRKMKIDRKKEQEIFKDEKSMEHNRQLRQEKRNKDDEIDIGQHVNKSSGLQSLSSKKNYSYLHSESTKSTTVPKNLDQERKDNCNQYESKDNHLTKQQHDDKRITHYDTKDIIDGKTVVPPVNICPTEQPQDAKKILKRSHSDEKEITNKQTNVNDIVKTITQCIFPDSLSLKLNNEGLGKDNSVPNNTGLSKSGALKIDIKMQSTARSNQRKKPSFESSLDETIGITSSIQSGSNATDVTKPNVKHTKGETQGKHAMKTRSQHETGKTHYAAYTTTQSSDGQTSVDVGSEHGRRLGKQVKEPGATASQKSSRSLSPNRCYCNRPGSSGHQYLCVLCNQLVPICDRCLSKSETKYKCKEPGNGGLHKLIGLGIETHL